MERPVCQDLPDDVPLRDWMSGGRIGAPGTPNVSRRTGAVTAFGFATGGAVEEVGAGADAGVRARPHSRDILDACRAISRSLAQLSSPCQLIYPSHGRRCQLRYPACWWLPRRGHSRRARKTSIGRSRLGRRPPTPFRTKQKKNNLLKRLDKRGFCIFSTPSLN
jgi:hypothetical protein